MMTQFSDLLLRSFESLLPDTARHDRCHFTLSGSEGANSELAGTYEFVDLYCQDLFCNCQKVSLCIRGSDEQTYATISFGWRSRMFYHKWGLDKQTTRLLTQGFIDPFAQQSPHSSEFLSIFLSIKRNAYFIPRLKERYSVFKEAILLNPFDVLHEDYSNLPENVIPLRPKQIQNRKIS